MKKIISLSIFLCFQMIFSQEKKIDCATTMLVKQNIENLKVLKYPEKYYLKKIQNYKDITNSNPEGLMISVFSANNLEWFNYNKEKKVEKTNQDFLYISKASPDNYFCELKYKIHFEANGREYVVIKYVLFDNQSEIGFAESMVKINNKWFTTTEAGITNLVFFMGMIDVKYINAIFNNSTSDNITLNKIISSNINGKKINITNILADIENKLNKKDSEILKILDSQRIFK